MLHNGRLHKISKEQNVFKSNCTRILHNLVAGQIMKGGYSTGQITACRIGSFHRTSEADEESYFLVSPRISEIDILSTLQTCTKIDINNLWTVKFKKTVELINSLSRSAQIFNLGETYVKFVFSNSWNGRNYIDNVVTRAFLWRHGVPKGNFENIEKLP